MEAEFIRTPDYQLHQLDQTGILRGDCDDAATLAAALLVAVGWPSSFVAYRMPGVSEFSHVNVHSYGVEIDPIVPSDQLPISGYEEKMEIEL